MNLINSLKRECTSKVFTGKARGTCFEAWFWVGGAEIAAMWTQVGSSCGWFFNCWVGKILFVSGVQKSCA